MGLFQSLKTSKAVFKFLECENYTIEGEDG